MLLHPQISAINFVSTMLLLLIEAKNDSKKTQIVINWINPLNNPGRLNLSWRKQGVALPETHKSVNVIPRQTAEQRFSILVLGLPALHVLG